MATSPLTEKKEEKGDVALRQRDEGGRKKGGLRKSAVISEQEKKRSASRDRQDQKEKEGSLQPSSHSKEEKKRKSLALLTGSRGHKVLAVEIREKGKKKKGGRLCPSSWGRKKKKIAQSCGG